MKVKKKKRSDGGLREIGRNGSLFMNQRVLIGYEVANPSTGETITVKTMAESQRARTYFDLVNALRVAELIKDLDQRKQQ